MAVVVAEAEVILGLHLERGKMAGLVVVGHIPLFRQMLFLEVVERGILQILRHHKETVGELEAVRYQEL
jgi:hypothetical protein